MAATVKRPGIPATFEPVDWNPPGLTDDPEELMASIIDPARRGELYPIYHQLRRVAPVWHTGPSTFHGAWGFTRFAETDAIFRNPRVVNDPAVVDMAFNNGDGSFYDVMKNVMLWQEPEPHQRVRNLVKAAFTPKAIAQWRPIAERVATELCDALEAKGGADLVEEFNYEIPFNVIAQILGIPDDDFPRIKQLAWDFARAGEKQVDPELAARGDQAARDFVEYFGTLAEERRARPADDLVTALVEAEADGERLTLTELVANCILLLQAGHETTQDQLGNSQVALFRNPAQLARLRDDPSLTKNAVEELLRYDSSVQINHRVTLDGLHIDGIDIAPRSMVYVFLGAVNRDPARYPEPDQLDLGRSFTHHLAFSFGAYYCLGNQLARTELAVGLRTLLDRFPTLRPATGEFEWRDTTTLRGPQRLEVTW
jgi:cytochrome P450